MNSNYMLLMMMAMGSSSSSSGNRNTDFLDAMLISSNMMPEMMRLMFAMMSIQKRNSRTDTLAKEAASALKILGDETVARKLKKAEIDARPELKALLDRVPTERDLVVGTTSVVVEENAPETRALAKGKARQA